MTNQNVQTNRHGPENKGCTQASADSKHYLVSKLRPPCPSLKTVIWAAPSENIHPDNENIRHPENDTITKHSPPQHPKKRRLGTNNYKTNATYETTDAQTKENCKKGMVSRKASGGLNQFYHSADYISFPLGSLGPLWYIWKWSSAHIYARGRKQCWKLHYCLWRVSIKLRLPFSNL